MADSFCYRGREGIAYLAVRGGLLPAKIPISREPLDECSHLSVFFAFMPDNEKQQYVLFENTLPPSGKV
jgi:hypothetical protein